MPLDTDSMGDWRRLDDTVSADPDGEPDVTFMHVSDLHGQMTEGHQVYYNNPKSRPDFEFDGEDKVIRKGGGIPRLAAKLEEVRDAYDDDVVTLMSGDTFHGTAVTTYTNGKSMLEPVNEHLRPDFYVPGNWDYSNEAVEDGNMVDIMESLDATVLANNLLEWDTEDLIFDPYSLTEVNGLTVGVVGMTNVYVDRMMPLFYTDKYKFAKHPSLLEEYASMARDDGADIVVAVSEIGLQWKVQAAKDIDNIDVMFSAHTHEYTHEPIVVEDTNTLVVESGMGDGLGRVDIRIRDGEPEFRHNLYCLVEGHEYTPEPDPAAERTVEEIREPFLAEDVHFERGNGTLDRPIDTVVGETKKPLYRQSFLESAWNTMYNDALKEYLDADLAISHGFRYGAAIPEGEITIGDLYTFFPMTAPVAKGDAYGQQIMNHMEEFLIDNFTPYVYDQEDGRVRNYSSNVEVTIDPTAKRGRRLVEMTVDGEPMDPDESYTVATLRRPGDPKRDLGNCGFPFRNVEIEQGTIPVDVLVDYLENNSPVDYEVMDLVQTPEDGGDVQNTPADGPYPHIQPGVDYANGEEYTETYLIPQGNVYQEDARNRKR
ncbi:bifunctional metallophosphatase/5'-nucleotidase [Natribaculum luteum]|uniref:Bifunctional metallophosphatase/5'-nucleotidase n=1 Tax=Natribaculum luteum TaxID=1586232 RepID=A0ABD5NZM2_9EURY|nr:bifunctional metallophosphatase/5'-nucleotidase [Natribaculum luteum]